MERQTIQKELILKYLMGVYTHPSADSVYSEIKKKIPQISRGTVYRVLRNLAQKKEIQEIPANVSRYDGDLRSHAHFICEKCDSIFDIFDECKECKILNLKKTKVGKIKNYQLNFYGICKNCQK